MAPDRFLRDPRGAGMDGERRYGSDRRSLGGRGGACYFMLGIGGTEIFHIDQGGLPPD